jgi:hypothetical protein
MLAMKKWRVKAILTEIQPIKKLQTVFSVGTICVKDFKNEVKRVRFQSSRVYYGCCTRSDEN